MFDLGWPELMLIMVVALLVIGPKELPNAIRTVTAVMRKVRAAAREFQSGLDDIARESGLDDVKRQIDDIEYYDPKAALDNIAESDKDLLDLQDDPDAGNSILDPAGKPKPSADDAGGTSEETPNTETAAVEAEADAEPGLADTDDVTGSEDPEKSDKSAP